jgi:hypothetical protein
MNKKLLEIDLNLHLKILCLAFSSFTLSPASALAGTMIKQTQSSEMSSFKSKANIMIIKDGNKFQKTMKHSSSFDMSNLNFGGIVPPSSKGKPKVTTTIEFYDGKKLFRCLANDLTDLKSGNPGLYKKMRLSRVKKGYCFDAASEMKAQEAYVAKHIKPQTSQSPHAQKTNSSSNTNEGPIFSIDKVTIFKAKKEKIAGMSCLKVGYSFRITMSQEGNKIQQTLTNQFCVSKKIKPLMNPLQGKFDNPSLSTPQSKQIEYAMAQLIKIKNKKQHKKIEQLNKFHQSGFVVWRSTKVKTNGSSMNSELRSIKIKKIRTRPKYFRVPQGYTLFQTNPKAEFNRRNAPNI